MQAEIRQGQVALILVVALVVDDPSSTQGGVAALARPPPDVVDYRLGAAALGVHVGVVFRAGELLAWVHRVPFLQVRVCVVLVVLDNHFSELVLIGRVIKFSEIRIVIFNLRQFMGKNKRNKNKTNNADNAD